MRAQSGSVSHRTGRTAQWLRCGCGSAARDGHSQRSKAPAKLTAAITKNRRLLAAPATQPVIASAPAPTAIAPRAGVPASAPNGR